MGRLRRSVRALHLWLGLGLGALMVLAGLTGSVLVFYTAIDAALHPRQAAAGTATPASYDRAAQTLRRAYPDKAGPWRLEVTEAAGAIPARYYNPPERAGRGHAPMMVWLSPDGTQVLRRDYWGDHAMTWIYDLHYQLQLGQGGERVFGYAGIALAVLLLSGLWAWWPRGSWVKALRVKPGAGPVRALRDWHKIAGLAGLPLLLMLTVTGVMLALPDETRGVLTPLLGPADAAQGPGHSHHNPAAGAASGVAIAPSRAAALAVQALPRARPAWIELPGASGGVYRIRMRQDADPSHRFPHSFVWIDGRDGAVLGVVDADQAGSTDVVLNWLHPLHDGSAGGLPLRVLVLATGLVPLGLFVTGLLRWRARRGARRGRR